jgi:hypothetical protein
VQAKLETVVKVSSKTKTHAEREKLQEEAKAAAEEDKLQKEREREDPSLPKQTKPKPRERQKKDPVEKEIDRIIDAQDNIYILSQPKHVPQPPATTDICHQWE